MSNTFYIQGWEYQIIGKTKVYAKDEYPDIDDIFFEADPSFQKDDIGWYTLENKYLWPTLTCNSSTFHQIMTLIGYDPQKQCSFSKLDLHIIQVQCFRIMNKKSIPHVFISHQRSTQEIDCLESDLIVNEKFKVLLEMVVIAIKEGKLIYWA